MEYSEEEKKAIEEFKRVIAFVSDNAHAEVDITKNDAHYYKTILNLIEKQQKEIEALKQEKEYLNCVCESDADNYISKEAIRELIQNLKDSNKNDKLEDLMYEKNWTHYQLFQYVLKELLGE